MVTEAGHITAGADREALRRAQVELEKAIELYYSAAVEAAGAEQRYREAKRERLVALKAAGVQATVRTDIAQGETAHLKSLVSQSEAAMMRCRFLIDAYRERMNNIRFLGRTGQDAAQRAPQ